MSKFKVGDKLVALESVKGVRNAIPQGQLNIMPTKVLEVVDSNDAMFLVIFDGYSGLTGSGWCFSQERYGHHFVKVPSEGDVVTELLIPAGKSLEDINVGTQGYGSAYTNPVGGSVVRSSERNCSEWAPQDAFVNGIHWPVSWLRFKYQDDEEVKVKKFSDLEAGDKVVFVGNEHTRLNGYNGLSPATTARCASQSFMTKGSGHKFWYADGSDWWAFPPEDYGTIYVDYVEPALVRHKFSVGDKVPVEDEPVACSGAVAEEPKKAKLTAQQKSAKRLLRLILKAQIESRRLRDITPNMQAGDVNLASLVLSIHPPRRDAIKAVRHFGLDADEVAGELKGALH